MSWALVLGGGGAVGHAFHAGTLAGLAQAADLDPTAASVLIGTSAGAAVAALLRCGVTAAELCEDLSRPGGGSTDGLLPRVSMRLPSPAPAAPGRVLGALARRDFRLAGVALAPRGRVDNRPNFAGIGRCCGNSWPADGLWLVAASLRTGRRVVLGREGDPGCSVTDAVAASSAVPVVFAPVRVGGEDLVDGGVRSGEHADLAADAGVDRALVLSPMGDRGWFGSSLRAEVAALTRAGITTVVLTPTPAVRAAMGSQALDASRRPRVVVAARDAALARADEVRALLSPSGA